MLDLLELDHNGLLDDLDGVVFLRVVLLGEQHTPKRACAKRAENGVVVEGALLLGHPRVEQSLELVFKEKTLVLRRHGRRSLAVGGARR